MKTQQQHTKEMKPGTAIFAQHHSSIKFQGNTAVEFGYNGAAYDAALYSLLHSIVAFDENSKVIFEGNKASILGGGVYLIIYSSAIFYGNSQVTFTKNTARAGGAVYSESYCRILFDGNATVVYNGNEAWDHGGSVFPQVNCSVGTHRWHLVIIELVLEVYNIILNHNNASF